MILRVHDPHPGIRQPILLHLNCSTVEREDPQVDSLPSDLPDIVDPVLLNFDDVYRAGRHPKEGDSEVEY